MSGELSGENEHAEGAPWKRRDTVGHPVRLSFGDRLGRYELLGLLGAGGMGEVYKARDTRLDRLVAIKVLAPQGSDSPDRQARFEREAQAAAALNHPHICNLLDVASAIPGPAEAAADAIPFLVMESRDGRFIVYATLDPNTQWDLWLLPMAGDPTDRTPTPFLQTPNNEVLGQFSPDGRWVAYMSDESGTSEVHIRAFAARGLSHRVSANGGSAPRWRADGRELFYLAPDGTMMAVTVRPGDAFEAGPPAPLFKTQMPGVGTGNNWGYNANYTVTGDGQRFLISTLIEKRQVQTTVVLGWTRPPCAEGLELHP
jgi:Protein kinase domain/WD40-like Beta Propeller Repeat